MAKQPDIQYVRFYTVGSAARKLAPELPELPKATPKPRKAKKIIVHIDPVAIFGILTAAFMLVCMLIGMIQLNDARVERTVMADYVRTLTENNETLTEEYAAGYDLQDIQQQALALGMVPADQVEHISIAVDAE